MKKEIISSVQIFPTNKIHKAAFYQDYTQTYTGRYSALYLYQIIL